MPSSDLFNDIVAINFLTQLIYLYSPKNIAPNLLEFIGHELGQYSTDLEQRHLNSMLQHIHDLSFEARQYEILKQDIAHI